MIPIPIKHPTDIEIATISSGIGSLLAWYPIKNPDKEKINPKIGRGINFNHFFIIVLRSLLSHFYQRGIDRYR